MCIYLFFILVFGCKGYPRLKSDKKLLVDFRYYLNKYYDTLSSPVMYKYY